MANSNSGDSFSSEVSFSSDDSFSSEEDDSTNDDPGNYNPMVDIRNSTVQEIGHQATWSVSTCKPDCGVMKLTDGSLDTYWQSDGQLPHLVNIQFRRKTFIRDVCIYVDYKLDESYTPGHISLRAGTNYNDLQEIEVVKLFKPCGWIKILTKDNNDLPLKTYMLQIAVISNLQNGRDTHLRQVKIHTPFEKKDLFGNFSSVEMRQYTTIR